MKIIKEPDFNTIYSMLLKLKHDLTLRDEVAEWAQQYVENYDLEINNEKSWELLLALSMFDIQINPGEYLYGKEDIIGWVKEFS